MAVSFGNTTVAIDGACGVDDALPLLEYLQTNATARLDLGSCSNLHSAVLQVLMAVADRIAVLPKEAFLDRWLAPLLGASSVGLPSTTHDGPGPGVS